MRLPERRCREGKLGTILMDPAVGEREGVSRASRSLSWARLNPARLGLPRWARLTPLGSSPGGHPAVPGSGALQLPPLVRAGPLSTCGRSERSVPPLLWLRWHGGKCHPPACPRASGWPSPAG